MLETIGIIILLIVIFVVFGICGWIIDIFEYIFEFLLEGFFKTLGCLFWIFIISLFLYAIF